MHISENQRQYVMCKPLLWIRRNKQYLAEIYIRRQALLSKIFCLLFLGMRRISKIQFLGRNYILQWQDNLLCRVEYYYQFHLPKLANASPAVLSKGVAKNGWKIA